MSIYTDAIAHYGEDSQWWQATEELAELIVAINHHRRGRIPDAALLDEMADVLIMIEQMELMLGCGMAFGEAVERKLTRLDSRIRTEKERGADVGCAP